MVKAFRAGAPRKIGAERMEWRARLLTMLGLMLFIGATTIVANRSKIMAPAEYRSVKNGAIASRRF